MYVIGGSRGLHNLPIHFRGMMRDDGLNFSVIANHLSTFYSLSVFVFISRVGFATVALAAKHNTAK